MNKKVLIGILSAVLAAGGIALGYWFYLSESSSPTELPDYSEGVSTRIVGKQADTLDTQEVLALEELTEIIGTLLYNVDESYPPANPGRYMAGTTSQDLLSLSSAYGVKSKMLESTLLDIRLEEEHTGDLLVCYLLEYESSLKDYGEYLFLVNLRVSRTADGGWICDEAASRGSALASDYCLSRDDLSGNIRLKLLSEED